MRTTRSALIRIHNTATSRWEDDAVCLTIGPDLWFPTSYKSDEGRAQATAAIAICHQCPVRAACLNTALTREGAISEDRRDGIWGGTTPNERYNHAQRDKRHRRQQPQANYEAAA